MTFIPKRYCSKCFTSETTRWSRAKDKEGCYWCNSCYMKDYNEKHREQKNTQSREYMRKKKHIVKKKKPPTTEQAKIMNRQLRYQLRRAEQKLEFLKWIEMPTIPLRHTDIWSSYPGVG